MSEDLELALALADLADAITLGRFRAEDLVVETKPDMTPVSEADRAVEQALRERLAALRPDDAVFGEEFGGNPGPGGGRPDGPDGPDGSDGSGGPEDRGGSGSGSSGGSDGPEDRGGSDGPEGVRRWIVDPIDGTKGYVRGMPAWATLLALEVASDFTVAVVSAPAMGRRWWAARGQGAFTNAPGAGEAPRRIGVSAIARLEDAQVCYGDVDGFEQAGRLEGLLTLIRGCWRARGFGDFWQYMLVAEGAAELASDAEVKLWDLAAPMLIVREAGGTFTDFTGAVTADGGNGLATNGRIHDAALALLSPS